MLPSIRANLSFNVYVRPSEEKSDAFTELINLDFIYTRARAHRLSVTSFKTPPPTPPPTLCNANFVPKIPSLPPSGMADIEILFIAS